jgi:hypothetical protein
MLTTETIPFHQLSAGDTIVAIDGHEMGEPRTIANAVAREDGALRLVRPGPNPHDIEWWLYPANGDTFTVQVDLGPALNVGTADPSAALLARLATRVPRMRTTQRAGKWGWIMIPPPAAPLAADASVGDVVLVAAGEYWRAAVVTAVGPKRYRVAYTTPHAVAHSEHTLTVTRPYVGRNHAVHFVPASSRWWTRQN